MRKEKGGLGRPLVCFALAWILLLIGLNSLGFSLRKTQPAEHLLEEAGSASGLLTGTLIDYRENSSGSLSIELGEAVFFPFQAEDGEKGLFAGRVLVYFPAHFQALRGSRIEMMGQLKRFAEADNPGEFDAKAYYLAQNMACYMEGEAYRIVQEKVHPLREAAASVRCFLSDGLKAVCSRQDVGALSAMLLGERSAVDEESEALFESAGLSHLFSVSGLHVGFWALALGRLSGMLLALFPFSRGNGPVKRYGFAFLRFIFCGAGILFYMLLCGARTPVTRAGLLALLQQAALSFGLSFDLPSALAFVALFILIPFPYALFQASFQLSFACVFVLGVLLPVLNRRLFLETDAGRALFAPVLLQTLLLPLMLWHFSTLHLLSVPMNLIVLPFAAFLLVGALLSALLAGLCRPLGMIAAGGTHFLLEGIRALCRLCRHFPAHSLIFGRPPLWKIVLYGLLAAAGLLGLIRIRQQERSNIPERLKTVREARLKSIAREGRRTALLLFVWLLAGASLFLYRGENLFRITSLYVGQGDCHVLELPDGSVYLMDAGGGSPSVGEKILLPYLQYRGIRRVDGILLSHLDSDHICAVQALLEADGIQTGRLILPAAFSQEAEGSVLLQAAMRAGAEIFYAGAGDHWEAEGVRFTVLFPSHFVQYGEGNDQSLILRVDSGSFCALFTGDLGEEGERRLLQHYGSSLDEVDYLKVGHHGSRYSSSADFLAGTTPRAAVISCGRGNPYGHPTAETLERLQAAGAKVYRTDRDGAVSLILNPDGQYEIQTVHERKNETMKENKQENSRSWLISAILVGFGLIGMILALVLPRAEKSGTGKTTVPESAASYGAESTAPALPEEGKTQADVSTAGTEYPFPTRRQEPSSWPLTEPAGGGQDVTLSVIRAEVNAGRVGPREDPQAPGFLLDTAVSDRLYLLFAGDLTNNTVPSDPFRSLTLSCKEKLDALSERFVRGELDAAAWQEAAGALRFTWPGEALEHYANRFSARCYEYPAAQEKILKERILLSNYAGRHYLFLRIYRNPETDRLRIYMLNAAIW